MARTFSARELIQLPTMDAHTTESFARRLLAQYRKHRGALRRTKAASAATALEHALTPLTAALAAQQARATSGREAAVLDPMVDSTWAALVGFLGALARLAWRDEGKRAQHILDAVFGEGLAFTQLKYPQQWSEANARWNQLHTRDADHPREPTMAAQIADLGGETFLDEVADKHARFAKALGLSEGTSAPATVDVRTPLDALLGAAKDYVAAAMQLDDRDVESAESVRHDLLFVIDEFTAAPTAHKADAPKPADPKPADSKPSAT